MNIRIFRNICLAAVMTVFAEACSGYYDPIGNAGTGNESALVSIYLRHDRFTDIGTRSSFEWGESEIKDVQIVIVDQSTGDISQEYASTDDRIRSLSFEGTVGHTYEIWAAANIGEQIDVTDLSSFISGTWTVNGSDIAARGIPMFSGTTDKGPGPVTLTVSGKNDVAKIDLVRMLARIDLTVNCEELDSPGAFVVKDVLLYNAINSYTPFEKDVRQTHSGSMDYSFDKASASDVTALNNGSSISLYAFENMQGTLLPENTDPWKKVPGQIDGAADYCTYLELEGSYTNGSKTYGKLVYRMYLGNDSTTNFDVKRNTIYSVTLYPTEEEVDGHRGSWKIESSDFTDNSDKVDYELVLTPGEQTIYENGSPARIKAMYYTITNGVRDSGRDVTNNAAWKVTGGSQYVQYAYLGGYTWKYGPGTATVMATYNGKSATATIHTEAHVPEVTYSMKITPVNPVIEIGETIQFHVEEWKYEDGVAVDHWADIHEVCKWSGSNTSASISSTGLATGNSAGEVTITASYYEPGFGTVSDCTTLTVIAPTPPAPVLEYIELIMAPDVIAEGEQSYGTVIAHFSDDTAEEVTGDCTWSSNAPKGVFTGTAPGTFTITAYYDGLSAKDEVTVNEYDINVE